ncbi:MAG: AbrB family transcriptional regulator, partial [Pirellulaceae bacterium]|nr:AbrB family transcriptional regulator [Pirellulaceae bacterium]
GDERKISLVHATRILLVVFAIPFWFQLVDGIQIGDRSSFGVSALELPALDYLLLGLCILIGWPIARSLRLPAPQFFGPLFLSAALHLSGFTESQPPRELVNLAQLVIGATIGARFVGTATREVLLTIGFGIGNTAMILGVCGLFAYSLHQVTDINVPAMILAYAPGGMPEMSLIALALGLDVAFVVTHHATRAAIIFIGTPMVFRLLERWRRQI